MSRQAVLVANSVTSQDVQTSVPRGVLDRTLRGFAKLLKTLPGDYAFNAVAMVDADPTDVRQRLERAASAAHASGSLLCFYYFGHGVLTADQQLTFAHPGVAKGKREALRLSTIETVIGENDVQKSLMILDCCFAGARGREFQPTVPLRGQHCRLAATTATARAYIARRSTEPPIGFFTQAILDGFSEPDACVAAHDNRITADSLFRYADRETRQRTAGVQEPYLSGRLAEPLSEYEPQPKIIEGYNEDADEKTGYAKLLVVCQTLASGRNFTTIDGLYRAVLRSNRNAFLTPFRRPNGDLTYRPAKPSALVRYIRLLRALGLIEWSALQLTGKGRKLARDWRTQYNQNLLAALDSYLQNHGLDRRYIEDTLRQVLGRRGLPARTEVFDRLSRGGHRVPASELGLLLDVLGYTGAIRMTTERAYFPW